MVAASATAILSDINLSTFAPQPFPGTSNPTQPGKTPVRPRIFNRPR
jgi:hypothetical protein